MGVTGDGRKAALDLRLVQKSRDHPESKINFATREIFQLWDQTKNERLTQIVFCDLSTPQQGTTKKFSVYDDLKAKLVQLGVPAEEIAFIQDCDGDAAKVALFKKVRAGRVRVLMGSTQMMGTGTNVQERLVALHHIDAPWRPADIEQREGRILRQGNKNPEVKIFRYVTEGSFDAYMWGVLETKAKFIGQIMTKESHVRRIEDLDAPALTYAEVKAIASGNPLVMEKAQVDAEVMRLNRLRSQHSETLFITRNSIRRAQEDIPRLEQKITNIQADMGTRQNTKGDAFAIKIESRTYENREKAGAILNRLAEKHHLATKLVDVGEFAGFKLQLWPERIKELVLRGKNAYVANISDAPLGTIGSLEHVVRSLDERINEYRSELTGTQRRIEELQPHAHKPFEHEEKLKGLIQRQQEIVQALDLTKDQASNSLAAEPIAVVEESVQEKQSVAPVEKQTRKLTV